MLDDGGLRLIRNWFNFVSVLLLFNYLHFYFILPASHGCQKIASFCYGPNW